MKIDQEITNFKKYLTENNLKGIAVDIDDTLSQTKEYLLDYFYRIMGNPENLTIAEFCQKYHLIQDAPYFQTPEALDLINKLTNSSDFFCDLKIIDNSTYCVNEINKIIPIVAYITMRPQATINVSQIWLDQHNFPKAKLIACPNFYSYQSAVEWKVTILKELYPQVTGIIDDSLGVAKKISGSYKGKIYLYNVDSYQPRPGIDIIPCLNWDCVLDKIHS